MTIERFGRVVFPCRIGDAANAEAVEPGVIVLELVDGGDGEARVVGRVLAGEDASGAEHARFAVDAEDLYDAALSLERFSGGAADDEDT